MKKENILIKSNIMLLMLILALSLVFCGLFTFNNFAQAKNVTLTVWEWDMNERPEAVKAIIAAFEKKYPNITINMETTDFNAMANKQLIAGEADALPDCLEVPGSIIQTMAKRGNLMNLDSFIEKEGKQFIDDFAFVWKDPWTKHYNYLPWRVCPAGFYRIVDYWDEAGCTVEPWTWEEFEEVAKKTTVDTNGDGEVDRYGIVDTMTYGSLYFMALASFGAKFENEDGTSALNSPEAIRATKEVIKIMKNYGPPNIAVFGPKEARDVFLSGKAATIAAASFMNPIIASGIVPGLKWKPFSCPLDINNFRKRTAVGDAEVYAISKNTKHPEEAWEFVKFICGPEADAIVVKKSKGVPSHKSNANISEVTEDPLIRPFANMLAMAEHVLVPMANKSFPSFIDHEQETLQKILYGKATVEEALNELVEKINQDTLNVK